MARPVEATTLRMNRTLDRLHLLTEEPATVLTKRRPPRIDAGGRRCAVAPRPRSFLVSGGGGPPARKATRERAPHNSARNSHVNLSGFEMGALVFQRFLNA